MENLRKVIKYFWIPAVIMFGTLSFAGYMAWKENKIKNELIDQALEGNQHAIGILKMYEKPWTLNERLVYEALDGNEYALEVLMIEK